MKDTLIIGGHEFHSRFILGSGKYSLEKMPESLKTAGQKSSHLLCAVLIPAEKEIFWIISQKALLFTHTSGLAMQSRTHCPTFPRTGLW